MFKTKNKKKLLNPGKGAKVKPQNATFTNLNSTLHCYCTVTAVLLYSYCVVTVTLHNDICWCQITACVRVSVTSFTVGKQTAPAAVVDLRPCQVLANTCATLSIKRFSC